MNLLVLVSFPTLANENTEKQYYKVFGKFFYTWSDKDYKFASRSLCMVKDYDIFTYLESVTSAKSRAWAN